MNCYYVGLKRFSVSQTATMAHHRLRYILARLDQWNMAWNRLLFIPTDALYAINVSPGKTI